MKKPYLAALCCMLSLVLFAQKKKNGVNFSEVETAIVEEGKKLYQLEKTSMMGEEIFTTQMQDLFDSTAGYFPYKEGKFYKCVFYNKMASAEILATLSFDSTFNSKRVVISTTQRPMTNMESDLFKMRQRAIDDVKRDTTFYKIFTNTTTTFIPLIDPAFRKIFILTKSDDSTAVIFGNDYVVDFDNANYISARKAIHNDLFQIEPASKDPYAEELPETVLHKHTGESGEFMTSTDVCILLLNQKKNRWHHHVVIGENYVSVWFCDNNELQTITKKDWYKYNKSAAPEKPEKPVAVTNEKAQTK